MSHLLVASLTGGLDAMEAALRRGVAADVAEVRLDHLWPRVPDADAATDALVRLTAAAQAADMPLLATLRPRRQGGAFDGDEAVRLNLLAAAAQAGFAWVDVEADVGDARAVRRRLREAGARVVASEHRAAAPARDEGLRRLTAMQDQGAQVQKLAFQAGSFADVLRALELAHAHRAKGGRPCVVPVGAGAEVRALLRLAGNVATYGHAAGAAPAVPGQPAAAAVADVWRRWGLGPDDAADHEPWYAVLGHPIAHSLSPRLHNAALRAAGLGARYGALDVPDSPAAFRLLSVVAPRVGLAGASVTAPHKERAAGMAARRDAAAEASGAANCLRFTAAGPEATNTDASAFLRLLRAAAPAPASVAVLGGGGAARAALWAAQEAGLGSAFACRDPVRGQALAARFGARWLPWEGRAALRADAWVQATPLGTAGEEAVPAAALDGARLAVELVYAGGTTPFQRAAQAAGAAVVDGRRFLVEQAVDAFAWWFGRAPDRAAMERALADADAAAPAPEVPA